MTPLRQKMIDAMLVRGLPPNPSQFKAIARGQLTRNSRYIEEAEKIIGRRIEHRRPGRPRMAKDGNK